MQYLYVVACDVASLHLVQKHGVVGRQALLWVNQGVRLRGSCDLAVRAATHFPPAAGLANKAHK